MNAATHVAIAQEVNPFELVGFYAGSMIPELTRDSSAEIDVGQLHESMPGLRGGVALHTKTERVLEHNDIYQGLIGELAAALSDDLHASIAPIVSRAGVDMMLDNEQSRKNQVLARYRQVLLWLEGHERRIISASNDPKYVAAQIGEVVIVSIRPSDRPTRFMVTELHDRFRRTELALPDGVSAKITEAFDPFRVKVAQSARPLWDRLITDIHDPDL